MQRFRKVNSCSTVVSMKSLSAKDEADNGAFAVSPAVETELGMSASSLSQSSDITSQRPDFSLGGDDSDANLLYVDRIENMKRILFPGTNDFSQLSSRARLCIARVEEELFELRRKRNEILRRESELIYTMHDTLLEEECQRHRAEMAKLSQIPDSQKMVEHRQREDELLQQIINIVNKRNILLTDLHVERLREQEEDEELNEEYRTHKKEWLKLMGSIEEMKGIKYTLRKRIAAWLEHMSQKFHHAAKRCSFG